MDGGMNRPRTHHKFLENALRRVVESQGVALQHLGVPIPVEVAASSAGYEALFAKEADLRMQLISGIPSGVGVRQDDVALCSFRIQQLPEGPARVIYYMVLVDVIESMKADFGSVVSLDRLSERHSISID